MIIPSGEKEAHTRDPQPRELMIGILNHAFAEVFTGQNIGMTVAAILPKKYGNTANEM